MVVDMDAQSFCSGNLGEGVRVEVRQRERGLRGSWHSGTIVGFKPGGRLVEYDELLSEDGLSKLRESISSPPLLTMQSPVSSRKRGILRPIPPVPTYIGPFFLKGGVFVDVFFQEAWWEAVLLDDVVSLEENAYVNVIYPDEGDLARVPVKDLRLSQLWDEVTGEWNLKGSCNLSRLLKRRGITKKETVPTTCADFESSQATPQETSSVQSKSKCCDQVCSFVEVGQSGGAAAANALPLDMTHSVQAAARAAVLAEDCGGGTASSGQQLASAQSSNAKFINDEPPQSICTESGREDGTSSASQSSNQVEIIGLSCRNELATFEGMECVECTNSDAKPSIDSGHSKDFQKAVFGIDTTKQHIADCLAEEKAADGVESGRPNTEVYESPCEDAGESLVSPPLLPGVSQHGEAFKSSCEKQETSGSVGLQSGNASPCEKETRSVIRLPSLPSASGQGDLSAHSCRYETHMVGCTHGQAGHLHLGCESMPQQCLSLPREFSHVTKGYDCQRIDGNAILNSCKKEMKVSTLSTDFSTSNVEGHIQSVCEVKQNKRSFGMGHSLERDDASSRSNLHKKVQVDMNSGNSICLSTPSQKNSNYLEERALGLMDKTSTDGQNSMKKSTDLIKVKVVSDDEKLGCKMETPFVNALADHAAANCRPRRKAKIVLQEAKIGTGLGDKPQNHGNLYDSKIEKRSESDTLRSFKDLLLRQKRADAVKRKALETTRQSEKVKKTENEDVNFQLFSKINHMESASKSSLKASMSGGKNLKFLTRDIAKKALLEAGFTIDLRPRRSRDYQDSVYVSPEGHAHWSLPKAWEALKKSQADKCRASDEQGRSKNAGLEKGTMSVVHGEGRRQSLAKADESAIKEVFSRYGSDERLQSALTKLGTCSTTHLEMERDATTQEELTNADLTDILLGDLGVLRRITKKFASENKVNIINSADLRTPRAAASCFTEKSGVKRKWDGAHASEVSDWRLLGGRKDSLSKSRQDRSQGTARTLTVTETKWTGSKHKAKKGNKAKARAGFRLEVRRPSSSGCEEPVCHSRRTIFAWVLDRGAVLERERIFFVDPGNKQVLKEGVVTQEGILCSCCKRVYTAQSFEAHAGRHLGDWHQALVFTSGKRLVDCQLKAWDAEVHLRKARNYIGVTDDDTNDDTCVHCGDGGDLICCDGCPSTFHASCLQIDVVPEGNWYCPKCSCRTCGGRQHNEEQEDPSVIWCNQCEHRYHIACLPVGHPVVGKEVLCGPSCGKIFSTLRGLVGIANPLGRGFSWTLLRCMEEDKDAQSIDSAVTVDYHSKLAVALLVIKECFNPMVDPRTNIDMITHAIYNRWSDFDRLNYSGFYTAVLEKEGEIISVASIRIHGVRLAEMPLIGTREKFRRQGMCRLLVGVIEKLLCSLEVAFFILPAIPELFETWTHAFGFEPVDQCLKSRISDISMMVFPGTELLQKPLLQQFPQGIQ